MGNLTLTHRSNGSLRILGALVAKDLRDAFRNRQVLSLLIMALILGGFYRAMPLLTGRSEQPNLLLYDAGSSVYLAELQTAESFNLYVYPDAALLPARLTEFDTRELALSLPADFDARLAAGETPVLIGQVPYWMSMDDANTLAAELQKDISAAVGRPVGLTLAPERVYPPVDGFGPSFLAAAAIVVIAGLIGLSLVPNLMLEEKLARTLDVLMVSPATPPQIVAAKAFVGFLFATLTVLPTFFFYGVLFVHWWLVAVALFLTIAFAVGVGLLVGSWATQRQHIQLAVLIVAQPLLVPVFLLIMVELMPTWLVDIFHWIPTVSGMVLLRAACTQPLQLANYAQPVAVLGAATLLVYIAVVAVVRRQDR